MKKIIVFLTLICVLLVFQSVFAVTYPTVIESQEYKGVALSLLETTGGLDTQGYEFYFCVASPSTADNCQDFDPETWINSENALVNITGTEAGNHYVYYQSYNSSQNVKGKIFGNLEATITPKPVTVEWTDADPLEYDGSDKTPTAKIKQEDLLPGDDPEIIVSLAKPVEGEDSPEEITEAINAGKYNAFASIQDPNYATAGGSAMHSFEIKPADIDNYEVTKLKNITFTNSEGEIVAVSFWPSILPYGDGSRVLNFTSQENPYTFNAESIEATYLLADGTQIPVNVVVHPEDMDKLTQFEDGEYTIRVIPADDETNLTGEIMIFWKIGRDPQPINIIEDFYYIGPRRPHKSSF